MLKLNWTFIRSVNSYNSHFRGEGYGFLLGSSFCRNHYQIYKTKTSVTIVTNLKEKMLELNWTFIHSVNSHNVSTFTVTANVETKVRLE